MKTPRLEDFAQTSTRPVKELHSPIDDMPRIRRPASPEQPRRTDLIAASPGDEVAASPPRPEKTAPKGLLVRRGFDYYAHKLVALKKLSLREQLAGRDGSMSRMLREALNRYLAEKNGDPEK